MADPRWKLGELKRLDFIRLEFSAVGLEHVV